MPRRQTLFDVVGGGKGDDGDDDGEDDKVESIKGEVPWDEL